MNKVIFITHSIYPLSSGDSIYNYGLVKELGKYSDLTVYSYVVEEKYIVHNMDQINATWNFYLNHEDYSTKSNLESSIGKVCSIDKAMLCDICKQLDRGECGLVILSHILMVQYGIFIKKKYPSVKLIYVSHNVETENYRLEKEYYHKKTKRKFIRNLIYNLYIYISVSMRRHYESFLLSKSDCYLTISKSDAEMHRKLFKNISHSIFCKPLIEFPCNKDLESLSSFHKRLLMAGSMNWFPNIEGAKWFIENVFSKLVEEGYTMYFVGGNPAKELYNMAKEYPDKIIVTGRVPTMDEYFEKCDISIIPLFVGTGAKIKVLESIGRGIPTISSDFAAKDYDIDGQIIIANTATEFIDAIHRIENDPMVRQQLFLNMQSYYKEYMKLNPKIIELIKA